jgi:hypothetical protein
MANKVDELFVEIKGDVKDLINKLEIATDSTQKASTRMMAAFQGVGSGIGATTKALGTFGLAVEGAKAAIAPFEAALERLNSAAGILRTANRLGVASDKLQVFTFAARSFGAESEDVIDTIKDLGIRIGEAAEGSEGMITALNRIGLEANYLMKLSPEDQFMELAKAVSASDAALSRLSLDEMLGDPGIRMVDVLREVGSNLGGITDEARELNQVLSKTDLEALEEAARSVEQLKMGFEGLMNEVLIQMAPLLDKVLKGAIQGIKEVNRMLGIVVTLEDKEARVAELKKEQARWARDMNMSGRSAKNAAEFHKEVTEEILELEKQITEEKAKQRDTGMQHGPFESTGKSPEEKMFNMQEEHDSKFGDDEEEEDEEEKKKKIDMGYGVYGPDDFEDLMERNLEQFAKLEEQRKAFLDRELNQYRDQIRQTQWLWESGAQGKLRVTKGFFNDLLTITQGKSRKMFEFNKALGIAEATISTFKGAAKALELPYPYNLVAMASVVASGMAQVAKIQSVEFGGGGAGGGGGASAPAAANTEALQQAEGTQTTNFDVTLQGDSFSGDQIRGLIGSINDATDDGVKLNAVQVAG